MVNVLLLGVLGLTQLAAGLVTLQTIGEVTSITKDATAKIMAIGTVHLEQLVGVGSDLVRGQARLNEDDEVEDVVAAALNMVDKEILAALNVPLDAHSEPPKSQPSCPAIIQQYKSLLVSTTILLRTLQEKQQVNRWNGESPVYHALFWMQTLWASRKANEQSRSFIEQQRTLYISVGCVDDENKNEVIRKGSELVEYMNDILDSFY